MGNVLTDIFLNNKQLYDVTGFWQREKRIAALVELNIPFRIRPADGYILVLRSYLEVERPKPRKGPNLDALRKQNVTTSHH